MQQGRNRMSTWLRCKPRGSFSRRKFSAGDQHGSRVACIFCLVMCKACFFLFFFFGLWWRPHVAHVARSCFFFREPDAFIYVGYCCESSSPPCVGPHPWLWHKNKPISFFIRCRGWTTALLPAQAIKCFLGLILFRRNWPELIYFTHFTAVLKKW